MIAPCCSKKWAPKQGEEWELVAIEAGHVFAWRSDSKCPRYQYARCVACGLALHDARPKAARDGVTCPQAKNVRCLWPDCLAIGCPIEQRDAARKEAKP